MKIGIIGAGHIGLAFAKQVANAGYEVFISNSRGPESLKAVAANLGSNVKAATISEAAGADVVFLGLQWQHLKEVTAQIPSWEGKIVIDPTNAILPGFVLADLNGKLSSEVLAGYVQGASVVKAFNTLTPGVLGSDPAEKGGRRVIFYSGNDESANEVVAGIIRRIGFTGIGLGRLDEGGRLQVFPGGPLPTLNLIKL